MNLPHFILSFLVTGLCNEDMKQTGISISNCQILFIFMAFFIEGCDVSVKTQSEIIAYIDKKNVVQLSVQINL